MTAQTLLVVFSLITSVAGGPLCFSCPDISHAKYCDYTERCADHQVCHVQKVLTSSGHYVFSSGCISNTTCGSKRSIGQASQHGQVTCIDCCHGDMCNNKGCGDSGPPSRPLRGPYCYQCDHMSDPSDCEQLTVCEPEEDCALEEYATGFFGEHTFSSGCKRREQCENYQPFGRDLEQRRVNLCNRCCSEDFCNGDCGQQSTRQTQLPTKVLPTASTTAYESTSPAYGKGDWLSWGPWSSCSVKRCGQKSEQIRRRMCFDNVTRHEVNNCIGENYQNKTCVGPCTDCKALYDTGVRLNGVYNIIPPNSPPMDVYCDMTDGGWIVLQNRFNGSVNFYRGWDEYADGFGNMIGEFWLGLNKIHNLTNPNARIIKLDLKTDSGNWIHVMYSNFSIDSEYFGFKLHLSGFVNGTITKSSFLYNNGEKFATFDRDNGGKCAVSDYAGWWFHNCTYLNPNGKYGVKDQEKGMIEHYGSYYNFVATRMKIQ